MSLVGITTPLTLDFSVTLILFELCSVSDLPDIKLVFLLLNVLTRLYLEEGTFSKEECFILLGLWKIFYGLTDEFRE